jgi:hypothetical protein
MGSGSRRSRISLMYRIRRIHPSRPIRRMSHVGSVKEKGQVETRPGLFGQSCPQLNNQPLDLFLGCRRWRRFPRLRTSPESQSAGHYDRDHDHFQKFQSISPPFAAGCSGLFRQGTTARQCFSQLFLKVSQPGTRFISSSRWCPRPLSLSPCVEHKHQNSKQWPKQPRS